MSKTRSWADRFPTINQCKALGMPRFIFVFRRVSQRNDWFIHGFKAVSFNIELRIYRLQQNEARLTQYILYHFVCGNPAGVRSSAVKLKPKKNKQNISDVEDHFVVRNKKLKFTLMVKFFYIGEQKLN